MRNTAMNIGFKTSAFDGKPAPVRLPDPFGGVLLVDKPAGPTSHDIVDAIRRRFRFKKVGHGGTLDPQATGVLTILIGPATKLSERFMGSDKTYEGAMRLGISTDSQDAQGKVIRESDFSMVTREKLEEATGKFKGDLMQTPPMVSAVKVDGVPLYKSARDGKEIERKPRLIHIYEFRLTDFSPPEASFVVSCTKGTYVRTLCSDIGDMLGTGAHLARLRRTRAGDMAIEQAMPFDEIMAMDIAQLAAVTIPVGKICKPN
jgi:tRNA pseudouridine55 synthase